MFFDLVVLNCQKSNFDYDLTEKGNKSPPLKAEHLKNFKLKMTGREIMCFIYIFPLLIGEKIPKNNKVWLFFIKFERTG